MYCPVFTSGIANGQIPFTFQTAPSNYGLKVPPGSWGAISGIQTTKKTSPPTTYGLLSLADQTSITVDVLSAHQITGFQISPGSIYFDKVAGSNNQMSLELVFTMNLANPIPLNGYILVKGIENLPFDFL